jgi:hypothetical protein
VNVIECVSPVAQQGTFLVSALGVIVILRNYMHAEGGIAKERKTAIPIVNVNVVVISGKLPNLKQNDATRGPSGLTGVDP